MSQNADSAPQSDPVLTYEAQRDAYLANLATLADDKTADSILRRASLYTSLGNLAANQWLGAPDDSRGDTVALGTALNAFRTAANICLGLNEQDEDWSDKQPIGRFGIRPHLLNRIQRDQLSTTGVGAFIRLGNLLLMRSTDGEDDHSEERGSLFDLAFHAYVSAESLAVRLNDAVSQVHVESAFARMRLLTEQDAFARWQISANIIARETLTDTLAALTHNPARFFATMHAAGQRVVHLYSAQAAQASLHEDFSQ